MRWPARSTSERFWEKVDNSGGPDSCWPFTGRARTENGYGVFGAGGNFRPRNWIASRFAWLETNGDPGPLFVLHRCDNPICCNPTHLFLGTQADNIADCIAKGRKSTPPVGKGESNPGAKLTRQEVENIRRRRKAGEQIKEIALSVAVSKSQVERIVYGRHWR